LVACPATEVSPSQHGENDLNGNNQECQLGFPLGRHDDDPDSSWLDS
jgi:hypothetical protein